MSDQDPVITLDSPPREPVDVKISLDSQPKEPIDVKIVLDSQPAQPFDVKVTPDSPPAGVIDVPITLDGPLSIPFQVAINYDGPPATPVDVTITPDPGPKNPVDPITLTVNKQAGITQLPDPHVVDPSTLLVNQQAGILQLPNPQVVDPSILLVNQQGGVTQLHDPQIVDPYILAINQQGVQQLPDPKIVNSSTFGVVPRVIDNASPGVPQLPNPPFSSLRRQPTVEDLIAIVKDYDTNVATFLGDLLKDDKFFISVNVGAGALDPRVLARWFSDYVSVVGLGGVAKFIAEQSVLYAMNPEVAQVFDGSYFLKMMIPGAAGYAKTTLDTELGLTSDKLAQTKDKVLTAKVQNTIFAPTAVNVYGPENHFTQGQDFSVDSLVDAVLDPGGSSNYLKTNIDGTKTFDASKYFELPDLQGAQLAKRSVKTLASFGLTNVLSSKLAKSAAIDGVIRVGFRGERSDGLVITKTQDPSESVSDDDTRIPVSFTDLRWDPIRNGYRSIYVQPLNLTISQAISPEYSEGSTFGRVDPTIGYQKTTRTLAVGFEMHAFAPEDLKLMYNKMVWLTSMCYPSFGADSVFQSGPAVRMRIGDIISTTLGGIPGVLKSLNFDFADALWELKNDYKVPRSFKVSLEFLVLHDGPVGIANGSDFGVWQLPGASTTDGSERNFAPGVTLKPGLFGKFGETRKG